MLRNVVEGFESIGRISIEKHLLATPSNTHVKAAFRTIDIAVSDKSWAGIKAKVEKNVQDVFDDCEGMIFDGLPSEKSELYTTRQVFFAAISAVIVTFKGKDGVVGSLNSLLIEIHKSTRDLRGLPPPEGQFDLVIGQLFRRIITVIAYATPTLRFRFPSLSRSGYNVVNQTDVQEQLHHIRWLVDDLQWRFGEFSAVLNQKLPPSFANQHPWPRSDFLRQTKERVVEVHSLPRGNGEAKRFQTAVGRLIEITDGLVIRLEEFEERIVENTYHEVDRLLQATKSTKSSLEMASNILAEVSRCLSRFSHALDTPKNKVALARSIVVTLGILQTLSSAIPSHAVHLTVVSAISKISVQNIEEKLSLNDEGIARLVSDLMLLTVCLDSGENVKGQAFTSMWEEALRRYNSLTSTDLGALANASGAETIEDLQRAVDQNQYASIRAQARGAEMRQALQPVLGFLHSFTGAIGEAGAFGGFFPSKAIAGSVMAVFDASQNIRNSIDMVFDLFKDLSAFLTRVKIHMKSEQNIVPDLKLMLTEMLCQFLLVMGTAYSIVRRGRLNRIVNYLARSPDVIADQVREFKRIYCNLDRLLLSLIFEGTYSLGSQHRASSLCYVSSQGGPPASTNVLLSQDRDQTLVTPPASKNPGSNFIVETGGENIGGKVLELLSPAPPPKRITSDPVVSSPIDSEPSAIVAHPTSPVSRPIQPTPRVGGLFRAYSTNDGLKILCLDGGGIRGLAEILVLKAILSRLAYDLDRDLKPCDVFDVIAGTGTGGLIAILFGRLGLSIQQALEVYGEIFQAVYHDIAVDDASTMGKKTRRFEKKVKEIIERFTKSSETKMLSTDSPSQTFVCATPDHNLPRVRLFRSYRSRTDQSIDCAIWEAARATTTMPFVFSDIEIGRSFQQELFVDGGLRCHNPTMELIRELNDNFWDSVACIVSLGAGKPSEASLTCEADSTQTSMEKASLAIPIDCEKIAEAVSKHFEEAGGAGSCPYWRFNIEPRLQGVSNVEWNRISEMDSHVQIYLDSSNVRRNIDELVATLANHPRLVNSRLR